MAFSTYISILALLCFAGQLNSVSARRQTKPETRSSCFRSVNVVNSTDVGGQNVTTWNSTVWKNWLKTRTEGIKSKHCQNQSRAPSLILLITDEERINKAFSKASKLLSSAVWSNESFPAHVIRKPVKIPVGVWSNETFQAYVIRKDAKTGVRKVYNCKNVYVRAQLDSNKKPIRVFSIGKKVENIFTNINVSKSCEEVQ